MLIFLLTSPILLIGQTYIGFGMGAGVSSILGAEGEVFNIDIEHASDYGLKKRLALSAFHATRIKIRPRHYGYSFLEYNFSTPIEFLQDDKYKKHFRAWKHLYPRKFNENNISLDIYLGLVLSQKKRSTMNIYIGPTVTRYEAYFPFFGLSNKVIEDLSDEKMEITWFSFVTSYDVGMSGSFESFYDIGNILLGLEIKYSHFYFSNNMYVMALVKLRRHI